MFSTRKTAPILIIGEDVINHPRAKNIAMITGLLQKSGVFKVLIIPPVTNSLGVSLICKLDKEEEGLTIGYNTKADFVLSAKGEGDLDMPALNQQEGTFVNIDKDLTPLNAGVGYTGYELNDIANALGIESENIIDYTSQLGFENIEFDSLENSVDNSGNVTRGYKIKSIPNKKKTKISEVDDLDEYNGSVVYSCNPLNQFNQFTKDCSQIKEKTDLIGSEQFALASRIKSGDNIQGIEGTCIISHTVPADFKEMPSYDEVVESKESFCKMQNMLSNVNNLCQKIDSRYMLQYKAPTYTSKDLDHYFSFPFKRDVPKKLEGFRFSIVTHRGCIGECNFCSVNLMQGSRIISRSEKSILDDPTPSFIYSS